eukprot:9930907-Alexandrium_andersonii.AAC.1
MQESEASTDSPSPSNVNDGTQEVPLIEPVDCTAVIGYLDDHRPATGGDSPKAPCQCARTPLWKYASPSPVMQP